MITVNDVRDGVIEKLKNLYPNSKVTGEEIKQGLGQNRYFVKLLAVGQSRGIHRRRIRTHTIDIRYFGSSNDEMQAVAEALYSEMESIMVAGRSVRGTAMRHEIIDEVLHFFVDYMAHVMAEQSEGIKMNSIEQEGFLK